MTLAGMQRRSALSGGTLGESQPVHERRSNEPLMGSNGGTHGAERDAEDVRRLDVESRTNR